MRPKCVRFLATLMILTVVSSAIGLRTTGTSNARLVSPLMASFH